MTKLSDKRDETSMQNPSAKAETFATVAKLICAVQKEWKPRVDPKSASIKGKLGE